MNSEKFMSSTQKYSHSKFRSIAYDDVKESNKEDCEHTINIISLPPEIYCSTPSNFPICVNKTKQTRKSSFANTSCGSSFDWSQRNCRKNSDNQSFKSESSHHHIEIDQTPKQFYRKKTKNFSYINLDNSKEIIEKISKKAEEILACRKEILNSVEKSKVKWNELLKDENEFYDLNDVSSLDLDMSSSDSGDDE